MAQKNLLDHKEIPENKVLYRFLKRVEQVKCVPCLMAVQPAIQHLTVYFVLLSYPETCFS